MTRSLWILTCLRSVTLCLALACCAERVLLAQASGPLSHPLDIEKVQDLKWNIQQLYPLSGFNYGPEFRSVQDFLTVLCRAIDPSPTYHIPVRFRVVLADASEMGRAPNRSPNYAEIVPDPPVLGSLFKRRGVLRISRSWICRFHEHRRGGTHTTPSTPGALIDPTIGPDPASAPEAMAIAAHEGRHFKNINSPAFGLVAFGLTAELRSPPELAECVGKVMKSTTQWAMEIDSVEHTIEALFSAALLYRFFGFGGNSPGASGLEGETDKESWGIQIMAQVDYARLFLRSFCDWPTAPCVTALLADGALEPSKRAALQNLINMINLECERRRVRFSKIEARSEYMWKFLCDSW